jgi:hypothetical protein
MNTNPTPRTVEGLTKVPLPTAPGLIRAEREVAPHPISGSKNRTFLLPIDLVERAKTAQVMSEFFGNEYSTLNAFVAGAIENEIRRISRKYNDARPNAASRQ